MFMYAKQSCINAVVPAPPSQFAMLYNDSQMMMVWSPVTEAVGYTMYWCRVLHNDRYCDVRRPSCRYTPVVLLIVTESQPVMLNEAKISRPRPGPCGRRRGPPRSRPEILNKKYQMMADNKQANLYHYDQNFRVQKIQDGGRRHHVYLK